MRTAMMIDPVQTNSGTRFTSQQNQPFSTQTVDAIRQKALQIGNDLQQIQQWCNQNCESVQQENETLQQETSTIAKAVARTLATLADRLQEHLGTCDAVHQQIAQQRSQLAQLRQSQSQSGTADAISAALEDQIASMRTESEQRPQGARGAASR